MSAETVSTAEYYHYFWKDGITKQIYPIKTGWEFLNDPEEDVYDEDDGEPIND